MTRRPRTALLCLLGPLALGPAAARAQDDRDGMRRPERLTVGVSHQLLGHLGEGGKRLYFLSNRNTIREVYAQEMEAARAVLLFDEGADVSWARVSPDGRRILYISFRDDAGGQLCVRDLPDRRRRCLADGSHAVEAQWMGGERIALVSRAAMQGDLGLREVRVGARLEARPLLARNLVSSAVSPDGRWLVYVPVERYDARVGPGFAARGAPRFEAVPLDGVGRPGAPQPLPLDLPGRSGQPAFSRDGRHLYFVQFLNDTNQDGAVDAADNGVLFRVPFEPGAGDAPARAARAFPEQLTDSAWNCQYPAPAAGQLIATCSRGSDLDIYGLPLDGVVPGEWDAERLRMEIDLSTRALDQQLLYRHLLRRSGEETRGATLLHLVLLHLESDEFDAAEFYTGKLAAAADPEAAGLGPILRARIAHRRALRARERGRLGLGFADDSRARLRALDPAGPAGPAAAALRRLVRSEITGALGDPEGARRELEAADLGPVRLPAVLECYYQRADAVYRLLDDGAALWEATRRLAEHPALPADDRLRYARAAARALVRGLPLDEAAALLARRRAEAAPGSELAFALELGGAVLRVRDDKPPKDVREALVALYKGQPRLDRRRAVVLEAVQRATELDAERVIEELVQLYVQDVPRGTRERRRAERLFQRFLEGRAYRRLARGRLDRARDDFAQVARVTGSFESHVGYIDLRLREGATPAALLAEYEQRDADYSPAAARFVRAYLLALQLPGLDDKAHEEAARRVTTLLRGGGPALRSEPTARALWGAVLHERFLRTGNRALAQRADVHYLVALELVRRNPRYRAMVLGQLGLLHAQVGNWRIAIGFLEERDKLPFIDDAGAVAHQLMKAQTLLHLGRGEEAAAAAEAALARCERTPALGEYRVLALDRAALYSLSVGRFARALALYDQELPLLAAAPGVTGERNRLVARLSRAAAALGAAAPRRALADLDEIDRGLGAPTLRAALRWAHTAPAEVLRSYLLIAAGLRARAHRALGELPATARALEARRALLQGRLSGGGPDEDLRSLALVEAQLAEVALDRGDGDGAARWVREGLGHADELVRRTKVPRDAAQLDLLWMAAELRLSGTGPQPGVAGRLRGAHDELLRDRDPAWRSWSRLLEIYRSLEPAEKK